MTQPDAQLSRGPAPSRRRLLAGLGALGLAGCDRAVGTTLPLGEMPGLAGLTDAAGRPVPGFAADEFRRGLSILNIWASWCPECRSEHGQLLRLAQDGRFRMLGLVFRDRPEAAAAYLQRAGNPYAAVALDDGRIARLLGQKGVPYSYVLNREGRVLARVRGSMNDKAVREIVLPTIRSTSANAGAAG